MGKALSRALALLARRAYTEAELRRRLSRYPEAEVEEALARLREWGYLDDRAYAEGFARSRKRRWGSGRLRAELLRRGVGEEVVEEVLPGEDEEVEAAVSLLARRWSRLGGDRRRAVGFLLRRGFPPEVAERAYERLREEPPEG